MYLLIIFLSINVSCLAGLFGRYLGSWGAAVITNSCLICLFSISINIFHEVALCACPVCIKLATWISSQVLHTWLPDSMWIPSPVTYLLIITVIAFIIDLIT